MAQKCEEKNGISPNIMKGTNLRIMLSIYTGQFICDSYWLKQNPNHWLWIYDYGSIPCAGHEASCYDLHQIIAKVLLWHKIMQVYTR